MMSEKEIRLDGTDGYLGVGSILNVTPSDELNEYEWAEGSIRVPIADLLVSGTTDITK